MKKLFCLVLVLLMAAVIVSPGANAQFNQKDMLISAGIGFGGYGYYGGSPTPPIFGAFEMGVAPKISVGGMVGYSSSSEEAFGVKASYTYIPIVLRGSYHFLEGQKNMDAYGGAGLGFAIASSSVESENPLYNQFGFGGYSAGGSYLFFDLHVGGRYFFSPKFAAMAELGYSALGYVRAGVSYNIH